MKFKATLKEAKRLLTSSNDIEYTIRLVTEDLPPELFSTPSDQLLEVTIERQEWTV